MTTVVVAAVGAGLVLAGILQGLFGALQGSFWLNAAACVVTIAAIAATVTGFAGLLGPAGVPPAVGCDRSVAAAGGCSNSSAVAVVLP
ncbi:MAG: hypothetical protein IE935_09215 [Micrococcales bacterium]|nr:hypothetical protein [Micrococcales bacterium]